MQSEGHPGTPRGQVHLAELAERSGLIFFTLRVRPTVNVEYLSEGIETHLGVGPREAYADAAVFLDRLSPADRALLAAEPGPPRTHTLRWRRSDGAEWWTRCWVESREDPDGSVVLHGTLTDVTDLQQRLETLEHRLRLLAENSSDVVWTQSVDGTVSYICDAVERIRGITREVALGQTIAQTHTPVSAARFTEYIQEVTADIGAGRIPPEFHGEGEYYRDDGSIMFGELTVIPRVGADGRLAEFVGIMRDVSERKDYETHLATIAATDALTGLCNRRRGEDILADAIGQPHPLALLMIDIDEFKTVNDAAGHEAGDRLLIHIGQRIRQCVDNSAAVIRWGGDEFVVLLRDCGLDDAMAAAERIRVAVCPEASVSVGVAERGAGEAIDCWLRRADEALYSAKASGRNAVRG